MSKSSRSVGSLFAILGPIAAFAMLATWPHSGHARRPAPPLRKSEYTFVGDPAMLVTRGRHEIHWPFFEVGYLDAAGNYLNASEKVTRGVSSQWDGLNGPSAMNQISNDVENHVYEFRSGRLIPGSLEHSYFMPTAGAKVINFSDYQYREGGPRIYNLPGRFVKTDLLPRKAGVQKDTSTPAIADRYVGMLRGNYVLIGEIGPSGDFDASTSDWGLLPLVNRPRSPKEAVYEYRPGAPVFRSWVLVKGELADDGNFIPDLGINVIPFNEYKTGKGAPRIYNLLPRDEPRLARFAKQVYDASMPLMVAAAGAWYASTHPKPPQHSVPRPAGAEDYVFVRDPAMLVTLLTNDLQRPEFRIGYLDGGGNFIPASEKVAERHFGDKRPPVFNNLKTDGVEEVYEFRSGQLVPGSLDKGFFKPHLGAKIIDFKDYRYREGDRRIYNLPGSFVRRDAAAAAVRSSSNCDPAMYGTGATDMYMAVLRGNNFFIGDMGPGGEIDEANWPKGLIPLINRPRSPNESVYEYRSGMLIKGNLADNGDFVPEKGGSVIPLNEYKAGKDVPRIYNLPGRFEFEPSKPTEKQPGAGPK